MYVLVPNCCPLELYIVVNNESHPDVYLWGCIEKPYTITFSPIEYSDLSVKTKGGIVNKSGENIKKM